MRGASTLPLHLGKTSEALFGRLREANVCGDQLATHESGNGFVFRKIKKPADREEAMHVALIQVPYMMGDERQGKGPGRLMQTGAEKLIATKGVPVTVECI